jgi:hypothetical protein
VTEGATLSVADCCKRSTANEKIVRGWLSAPESAPDHLPSVLATKPGLRSGRSAYRVRPTDLEALLARLGLPHEPIRLKETAEIFAGRSLSKGSREYERHAEAVRAEVKRGRLTVFVIEPGFTRYSRPRVEEVAELRRGEGYGFEPAHRRRAAKAERVRAQRDDLLTLKESAARCGVHASTAYKWHVEERYGAVKHGRRRFFPAARLPITVQGHAKPTKGRVTVTCAVCGTEHERYASEVRKTEQRAKSAGRPVLFFCREHLNTEKARTLLGHPARKRRPKPSAETRARQSTAQRAAWPPKRKAQQGKRMKERNERVTAGEYARRKVNEVRTRYGSEVDEREILTGITTRRSTQAVRKSKRVLAAAARAQEAVEMRQAGLADDEICSRLMISPRQLKRHYAAAGLPVRKHGHRPTVT